jgi:hypothetical protein
MASPDDPIVDDEPQVHFSPKTNKKNICTRCLVKVSLNEYEDQINETTTTFCSKHEPRRRLSRDAFNWPGLREIGREAITLSLMKALNDLIGCCLWSRSTKVLATLDSIRGEVRFMENSLTFWFFMNWRNYISDVVFQGRCDHDLIAIRKLLDAVQHRRYIFHPSRADLIDGEEIIYYPPHPEFGRMQVCDMVMYMDRFWNLPRFTIEESPKAPEKLKQFFVKFY